MNVEPDSNWYEKLGAICQRGGVVEMTDVAPSGRDRLAPTHRVRLLACTPEEIVVEMPRGGDAGVYLEPGSTLRILLVDAVGRWEFNTLVTGARIYPSGREGRTMGLRLAPPSTVRSAQRRSYFRVSTESMAIKLVRLVPVEPAKPASAAHDPQEHHPDSPLFPPQAFTARLLNIGGGGIGVQAPARVAAQVNVVQRYACRLELPILSEPLEAPVRVVHRAPVDGGAHYLGLRFDQEDPAERRKCIDEICRFTAWMQRLNLHRQIESSTAGD